MSVRLALVPMSICGGIQEVSRRPGAAQAHAGVRRMPDIWATLNVRTGPDSTHFRPPPSCLALARCLCLTWAYVGKLFE